jgi:hypothetical protein
MALKKTVGGIENYVRVDRATISKHVYQNEILVSVYEKSIENYVSEIDPDGNAIFSQRENLKKVNSLRFAFPTFESPENIFHPDLLNIPNNNPIRAAYIFIKAHHFFSEYEDC